MRKFLRILGAALALFIIFALISCVQNDTEDEITFIIDRTSLKMSVGDVYAISWSVVPPPQGESCVTWVSSNSDVVTCEGGVVRAVGEGRAIVTATHSSGRYEVCSITVENNSKKLYMLEGEELLIKDKDINVTIDGAECISKDTAVAEISDHRDGVVIRATGKGYTEIRLEKNGSSLVYYNLIVLSAENSGVNIVTDETPLTVNYDGGRYKSTIEITDISVEKRDDREYLDQQMVQVELVFTFRKVYDSDGDDANNLSKFVIEVYSDEHDEMLKTLEVNTGWLTVADGETKEYVYLFNAAFEYGDERNFDFIIKEIGE